MPFAIPHLYITVGWAVSGIASEQGQFGIRVAQTDFPSEGDRNAIATATQAMWVDTDVDISAQFLLHEIKFAQIGTDGRYPPESESIILDMGNVPGGQPSNSLFPLQVSHVASLFTSAVRGRGHRGRIYLPPINIALTTQMQWQGAQVNLRAGKIAAMLSAWNTALEGDVAVMSKEGTGTVRAITGVSCGTRPDVQRRRARQQAETYGPPSPVSPD